MFVGLHNPFCFASKCLFERPRQDPAHESSECVLADEVEISDEEASVEDPNNDGVEAGGDSEEESAPIEPVMESQLDSSPPNDSLIVKEISGEDLGGVCEEDEPEPLADGDALGSPSVRKIEVGRLNRGKSHVFHLELPAHEGSKNPQVEAVEKYEETDEHVIADDKKRPLFSPSDDVKVSQMEAHLKRLREKYSAVKGRRMANEALAAGAAAEAAKGQVIPVEDSLPYGRDTMETMEMDGDAENLMEKFNSVAAALEVESGDTADSDPPVPWHMGMNRLYFPKKTSNPSNPPPQRGNFSVHLPN